MCWRGVAGIILVISNKQMDFENSSLLIDEVRNRVKHEAKNENGRLRNMLRNMLT